MKLEQKDKQILKKNNAQTAIEYLLVFGVVAVVVLVGFQTLLPRSGEIGEDYYNRVSEGIMGEAPFISDADEVH